ncbi:MAG: BrnA antitoxin family protein [Spirochaetes bacterium]|jgi:predicted DNA binding CopG/RHH family protein|nr:BrnA antitoxin family protein [Spirochaetota bacterium]
MKTLKKIPKFMNETEEFEFWANNDSTEFLNLKEAKKLHFKNLKPSTKSISIRLPESLLERIKIIANKNDVPYQSLIKIYLSERVKKENVK